MCLSYRSIALFYKENLSKNVRVRLNNSIKIYIIKLRKLSNKETKNKNPPTYIQTMSEDKMSG